MKLSVLTCAFLGGVLSYPILASRPPSAPKCATQLRLATGMDETHIRQWYQKQFQRDIARTQAKRLDEFPEFYRGWLAKQQLPQLEAEVETLIPRVKALQEESLRLFHQLRAINGERASAASATLRWNVITSEGEAKPVRESLGLFAWRVRLSAIETEYEIASQQYFDLRKELEGKKAALLSLRIALELRPPLAVSEISTPTIPAEVINYDTGLQLERDRTELRALQEKPHHSLTSAERERIIELGYDILAAETYLMGDSEPDLAS